MIHVLAVITAKPGKRDTILAAFRENRPNVLAEDTWDLFRVVLR